jgi:hypothetical protein
MWTQTQLAAERVEQELATTQLQATIMQKQLEATDRPWLKVDASVATPLTVDQVVRVGFKFRITNIGKSPAQNINEFPQLIYSIKTDDILRKQKELCEASEMQQGARGGENFSGYTLFPADTAPEIIWNLTGPMSQFNEDNSRLERSAHIRNPFYVSTLVVCVDYTFGPTGKHHQTAASHPLTMRGRMFGVDLDLAPIPAEALDVPASPFFERSFAN